MPDIIGTPITYPTPTPPYSPTLPLVTDRLAVSLSRYAQIVDYSEAAFFGVRQDGQEQFACRTIWKRWQRQAIARELSAAQGEFWKHVGYPFLPTFIAGERHDYNRVILTEYSRVIGLGQKVVATVASGAAVSHATDPAVITVAGVTFTDPTEVHIYHPGSDAEIIPSSVAIVAGTLTIRIPRVRMVQLLYDDNPDDGWDYLNAGYFDQTVDVKREYLDSTHAVNVNGWLCSTGRTTPTASTFWNDAYIKNGKIGDVRLHLPPTANCGVTAETMDLYYLAGLVSLSVHQEDAIIRLAHARLPDEPCGCDFLKSRWELDKHTPDILTAERENCPWGLSDGAWQAWQFATRMMDIRATSL